MKNKTPTDDAMKKAGFVDWNKIDMDTLVTHLNEEFQFSSSGTAFAVNKLIEFYKEHKK